MGIETFLIAALGGVLIGLLLTLFVGAHHIRADGDCRGDIHSAGLIV